MKFSLRRWMPFVYFVSFAVLGTIGPYMAQELGGRGVEQLGLLLVLPALSSLFVSPLWSLAADRWQAWGTVMRTASFLCSGGLFFLAFSDPRWAFAAMAIHSVGRSPITPIIDALAMQSVGGASEDYGPLRLWGSLGFLLGALGIAAMKQFIGGDALVVGAALSFAFFGMTLFLPKPEILKRSELRESLRLLTSDRQLQLLLFGAILHFAPHMACDVFLAVHIESLGLPPLWTGLSITCGIIVEVFALWRGRTLLSSLDPAMLFMISACIALIRWLGMSVAETGTWVLILQASHGLSFGLFWLAAVSIVSERTPKDMPATGQALLSSAVGGIGAGGGIYIAAKLAETYGTASIFQIGMLAEVCAIACAWLLVRWRRAEGATA
jgi:MFS transporter, PPP family, 3-phenylpropionic acid transporter